MDRYYIGSYSLEGSKNLETIVVGFPGFNNVFSDQGMVRVYQWNGKEYIQKGQDLWGSRFYLFGAKVDISVTGDRIAVLEPDYSGRFGQVSKGKIYIYDWNGSSWQPAGSIVGIRPFERFGRLFDMSDNGTVIVGYGVDYDNNRGVVRIYEWDGSQWNQLGSEISLVRGSNNVATNYDGSIIGATSGNHTLIFSWNGNSWIRRGDSIVGNIIDIDSSGNRVVVEYQDTFFLYKWDMGAWQLIYKEFVGSFVSIKLSERGNSIVHSERYGNRAYVDRIINDTMVQKGEVIKRLPGGSTAQCIGYNEDIMIVAESWLSYVVHKYRWPLYFKIYEWTRKRWIDYVIYGADTFEKKGIDVSVNFLGDIVAVSSLNQDMGGTVHVYKFDGSSWEILGNILNGNNRNKGFGRGIDLDSSGTTIVIGDPYYEVDSFVPNIGNVRVYQLRGTMWVQKGQNILGNNLVDERFGYSVAINKTGNIIAAGTPFYGVNNVINSGRVAVYQWNDSNNLWIPLGNTIYGDEAFAWFGADIALNGEGNRLVVGQPASDINCFDCGKVIVYEYKNGQWIVLGSPLYGTKFKGLFGWSVSINDKGNRIAVGAPFAALDYPNGRDTIAKAGAVYVYEFRNGGWIQLGEPIKGYVSKQKLGFSVSLSADGNYLVVGSPGHGNKDSYIPGSISVYKWDGSQWVPVSNELHLGKDLEQLGFSVDISGNGNVVVAGAPTLSEAGLDSVGAVVVYKKFGLDSVNTIQACDSFILFSGRVVHASGVYYDTIITQSCNREVIRYNLIINHSSFSTVNINVCDSFVSPTGKKLYASGIVYDTLHTSSGCDSVVKYQVVVNRSFWVDTAVVGCDSFISAAGKVWYNSGLHYDTFSTASGCDSIIAYNLLVYTGSVIDTFVSACDSFVSVTGKVWYSSGIYVDTVNSLSCVPVVRYNLTIHNSIVDTQVINACDSFVYGSGKVAYSTGVYYDTLTTTWGCDSIVVYDVIVHSRVIDTLIVNSCDQFVMPSGTIITNSGIYVDTIHTTVGCDSIVFFDVNILRSSLDSILIYGCDSVILPTIGVFYNNSVYYDTLQATNGCDSVIKYKIHINHNFVWDTTVYGCDSVILPWTTVYSSGIYSKTFTSSGMCDSTLIYHVTIFRSEVIYDTLTACDSFISPTGLVWYSSGVYYDTVVTPQGCNRVFVNHVIITSNNDTPLLTVSGDTLIALTSGEAYRWYLCPDTASGFFDLALILGEEDSFLVVRSSGSYAVEILKNGCWKLSPCVDVIVLFSGGLPQNINVKIIQSKDRILLEFNDYVENISFSLYSMTGKLLMNGKDLYGERITINTSELPVGQYLLFVKFLDSIKIEKIAVLK